MELGSLAADFDEAAEGFFVEVVLIGIVGGDVEDVEIGEIVGHLRPERLEDGDGVGVVFGEHVAETEEVAGLLRVGLVADDRGERCDGAGVVAAAVFYEADVEANAGHFGFELFGFLKKGERVVPLFAAHGDDAEIGVSSAGLRIDGENATESCFGSRQVAGLEGGLALRESDLGVDGGDVARDRLKRFVGTAQAGSYLASAGDRRMKRCPKS